MRGSAVAPRAEPLIFLAANVVSETMHKAPAEAVVAWLVRNDAQLALPTVTIAEIAYGIGKIDPARRPARLADGLAALRPRYVDRIFGLTEEAALVYGEIMGEASRTGHRMTAPDGMIAAIARANGGALATRNISDFTRAGLALVDPWLY